MLNNIRRCFNKASGTYDEYSLTQQKVGANLIETLGLYTQTMENIIDLGCGSGIVTEQLALQYRYNEFYAIDIADQLLLLANKRLTKYKILTLEQDFDNLMNKEFNLMFANMSLQWSLDIAETIKKIAARLHVNGILAFSIPLSGTFPELINYSRNHYYLAEQIQHYINNAGLECIKHCTEYFYLSFSSTKLALKTIKSVGANCVFQPTCRTLKGKTFLERQDVHALTYHIGYFIARGTDAK